MYKIVLDHSFGPDCSTLSVAVHNIPRRVGVHPARRDVHRSPRAPAPCGLDLGAKQWLKGK